jgi:predicted transcriptional regulator
MEDLFLEDEYVVTDSFNNFVQSSRWLELLSKLEERDENCFIIKTENGKIQLVATKYIFREIKSDIEKEIEDFIRLHCCHSETLKCDKGVYL